MAIKMIKEMQCAKQTFRTPNVMTKGQEPRHDGAVALCGRLNLPLAGCGRTSLANQHYLFVTRLSGHSALPISSDLLYLGLFFLN